MSEPYPIEKARDKSRETPMLLALVRINNHIERASNHQKWSVEVDLTAEVRNAGTVKYPQHNVEHLRGEEAAKLLPNDYRDALALFRREGYGIQYLFDKEHDYDEPGAWIWKFKVIINW